MVPLQHPSSPARACAKPLLLSLLAPGWAQGPISSVPLPPCVQWVLRAVGALLPWRGGGRQGLHEPVMSHLSLLWLGFPIFSSGVLPVPTVLPRALGEPSELCPKCSSCIPLDHPQGFLLSSQPPNPINCRAAFILYAIFQASRGQSIPTCCCSQWRGRKQSGCGLLRMKSFIL